MPNIFARCVNTDYCSLGDRRLVMRLDDNEPLFCPECAQKLVPAPPWGQRRIPWPVLGALAMGAGAMASGYLVVLRWPHAMSYLTSAPIVSRMLALGRSAIVPTTAGDTDLEPSPAKLFLAAAMDDYLPPAAGDFVLRQRRARPPRLDQAVAEATASLEAGVPPVPWPEEETGASMPWRQALIMAALVSPSQPLGAAPPSAGGQPTIVVAPPAPPMPAAPASAPATIVAPQPAGSSSVPHGVRPQAALQTPVPQAAAQVYEVGNAPVAAVDRVATGGLAKRVLTVSYEAPVPDPKAPAMPPLKTATQSPAGTVLFGGDDLAAYRGSAAGMVLDPLAMQGDLTGLIIPMTHDADQPNHTIAAPQPALKATPAAPQDASTVPPILRAPKAPAPIATSQQAAVPRQTRAVPAMGDKPVAHAAIAQRPTAPAHVSKKLAKNETTPRHIAKQERAPAKLADAAPAQVAAPPVATVDAAAHETSRDEAAATPHAKIVVAQSGFSMSYTPLKDVNLTSIVMPARPTAEKPAMGSLKVDCVVETNGVPSDCHVVHAERAAAVSSALLAWMSSGLVHRAPTLKDGHPVRARQSWTLAFPAEARRAADAAADDTP